MMHSQELTPYAALVLEEYSNPLQTKPSDAKIEFLKNYAYFLVNVTINADFTEMDQADFESLNTEGLFAIYNLLINDGPNSFSTKIDQNYALNFLRGFDVRFQDLMGVRAC